MLTKSKSVKLILLTVAALMLGISANAQINLSLKNVKVSDAITVLNRTQGCGPQQSNQCKCFRSIDH